MSANKTLSNQEVREILLGRKTPIGNPPFVTCDECDRAYGWNKEQINYVSANGDVAVVCHMAKMTGEYLGVKYRCVCGNNLYKAY